MPARAVLEAGSWMASAVGRLPERACSAAAGIPCCHSASELELEPELALEPELEPEPEHLVELDHSCVGPILRRTTPIFFSIRR